MEPSIWLTGCKKNPVAYLPIFINTYNRNPAYQHQTIWNTVLTDLQTRIRNKTSLGSPVIFNSSLKLQAEHNTVILLPCAHKYTQKMHFFLLVVTCRGCDVMRNRDQFTGTEQRHHHMYVLILIVAAKEKHLQTSHSVQENNLNKHKKMGVISGKTNFQRVICWNPTQKIISI